MKKIILKFIKNKGDADLKDYAKIKVQANKIFGS